MDGNSLLPITIAEKTFICCCCQGHYHKCVFVLWPYCYVTSINEILSIFASGPAVDRLHEYIYYNWTLFVWISLAFFFREVRKACTSNFSDTAANALLPERELQCIFKQWDFIFNAVKREQLKALSILSVISSRQANIYASPSDCPKTTQLRHKISFTVRVKSDGEGIFEWARVM
jgi:hypothetical protein